MASVESRTNKGKKTYRIRLSEGEHPARPRIGLGAVTKKDANTAKTNIENLVNHCNSGGAITRATQDWLITIKPFVKKRLVKLGLIELSENKEIPTVKQWCETYISMRKKDKRTKSATIRKLQDVSAKLSLFFKGTLISEVNPLQAKDFRSYLSGTAGLAENTVRKHISISR